RDPRRSAFGRCRGRERSACGVDREAAAEPGRCLREPGLRRRADRVALRGGGLGTLDRAEEVPLATCAECPFDVDPAGHARLRELAGVESGHRQAVEATTTDAAGLGTFYELSNRVTHDLPRSE